MMLSQEKIPLIVLSFFVVDLLLSLGYLFNYLIGEPFRELTLLLHLNLEGNLPTWYSSIKLFAVSVLFGIFAFRNFKRSSYSSWLLFLFPLLFLVLSIDEIVQIHEALGQRSDKLLPGGSRKGTLFQVTGIWMFVIGAPFLAFVILLTYSVRRYFTNTLGVLRKFLIGVLVMLMGALGFEMLSNFMVRGSFWSVLVVFSEELCEMLGVTIIIWAICDLLVAYRFSLHLDEVVTS